MQAIIMAGGKGTRLRPFTNILPKPLLPLGLRSILDINIRQLVNYGIDNIIVSVGYLGELIENVIGNGEKYGINISYSYEDEPLGTVGGLSLVLEQLEDNFIVMNGDILHNLDFKALYGRQITTKACVTIAMYKQLHQVRLGVLETDGDAIVNYVEKPTQEYLVSLGIYLISRSVATKYIRKVERLDFPDFINRLIRDKMAISSLLHDGLWIDLGTPEEYMGVTDGIDGIMEQYPEIPLIV